MAELNIGRWWDGWKRSASGVYSRGEFLIEREERRGRTRRLGKRFVVYQAIDGRRRECHSECKTLRAAKIVANAIERGQVCVCGHAEREHSATPNEVNRQPCGQCSCFHFGRMRLPADTAPAPSGPGKEEM